MSRALTFEGRTTFHRREVIQGIAWLLTQRPNRIYETPKTDLTSRLVKELGRHGMHFTSEHPPGEIARALRWLEEHDYALCTRANDSNYTAVMLADDVTVEPPTFVLPRLARQAHAHRNHTGTAGYPPGAVEALAAVSRADQRPPVPSPAPPWLRPLEDKLRAWHRTDPRGAEQWAAEVMAALP